MLCSSEEEHNLRQRCQDFLMALYKQLKQRLSDNFTKQSNVSLFSVNNVLQPIRDLSQCYKIMEYFGISGNI